MGNKFFIKLPGFFGGEIGNIAVAADLHKVLQIIGQVIFGCVFSSGEDGAFQIVLVFQLTEGIFKGINDLLLILRFHLPDGNRTGIFALVGIGNIKVMG